MFFSQDMFSDNMFNSYLASFNSAKLNELLSKDYTSSPITGDFDSIFSNSAYSFNNNFGASYDSLFYNNQYSSNNNFEMFRPSNVYSGMGRANLGSYSVPAEYSVKIANYSNESVYRDQSTIGKNVVKNAFQFYGLTEKGSNNPNDLQYGNNLPNKFFGFNNPDAHWCSAFATYFWNQQVGYDIFGSQGYNRYNQSELGNGPNTKGGVSTWARANNVWTDIKSNSIDEIQNTTKPGDFIIYNDGGKATHIGIIVKIENGVAYTIEGNINGKRVNGEYLGQVNTKKVDLNAAKQDGTVDGFVRMNEWADGKKNIA